MVRDYKILCGIDFSEHSKRALREALLLREKFDGTLILIHVVPSLDRLGEFNFPMGFREEYEKQILYHSQGKMDELKQEIKNEKIKFEIIHGDPALEIIKYAKEEGINVIVIGSHGAKSIHERIFGSIAEKILKLSDCPVLVVK